MSKTLNDLLEVAINHEIKSWKMYSKAFDIVNDREARLFLKGLIEEEKGHQTLLESLKTMEIYDGSIEIEDEDMFEIGIKSHDTDMEINANNLIEEIRDLALKREYKAQKIFEKMAAAAGHEELKTLFRNLAAEEANHHKEILNQFSRQKGEMGYEM